VRTLAVQLVVRVHLGILKVDPQYRLKFSASPKIVAVLIVLLAAHHQKKKFTTPLRPTHRRASPAEVRARGRPVEAARARKGPPSALLYMVTRTIRRETPPDRDTLWFRRSPPPGRSGAASTASPPGRNTLRHIIITAELLSILRACVNNSLSQADRLDTGADWRVLALSHKLKGSDWVGGTGAGAGVPVRTHWHLPTGTSGEPSFVLG